MNFKFCNHSLVSVQEYALKDCQDDVLLTIRDHQPMDSVFEFLPTNNISYMMHLTLYHRPTIYICIKAFDVIAFGIVLALFS